jgi:aminopeptidase N
MRKLNNDSSAGNVAVQLSNQRLIVRKEMKIPQLIVRSLVTLSLFAVACQQPATEKRDAMKEQKATTSETRDAHSYANFDQVRVKHVALDLETLFDRKVLKGSATLTLERLKPTDVLKLDTRDLKVSKVEASGDGKTFTPTQFSLGAADKILGAPLTVQLPCARLLTCALSTNHRPTLRVCSGSNRADRGKKQPYMFTQSEAIHARSWIPLQDSPAVRVTYTARIRTPKNCAP